ncbi:tetratricopeptide repeat protein [Actinacidiphila oryziradicis]|uniref:Tetratricopeptide repeat protein n=1 Tax=Actinacidiphila oryziradicis TaxID=2571141 RepID=A0A4U0T8V9_9ACTN|nr:tetratricopeptide repeat protein [Actinacidiphila oryziradicis]
MRPTGFVNRRSSIRRLDELLQASQADGGEENGVALSAVAGAPGVGKTALVVHWAHGVRERFPDGDLYMDMQGYGPHQAVTPLSALDAFLRALDTPADRIPETLEERSALFRSLLAGKRVLVLLDNASSSPQVRPLIPATPDSFTLVTSRSALPGLVAREGAMRMTLDVLTPGESVALLSRFVGRSRIDAEPAMALRVAELCGYLPLALRVVGERASNRHHLSLEGLVGELVDERVRLDALASLEDELSDTRAVFSWSYRALVPDLQQAFRRLGLQTGSDIGVDAAAALIGCDVTTAKRQLRALVDVHLLQEVFADRYRMHDLLRSYATEQAAAEDSQGERTQTVRRLLTWYLLVADLGRCAILPHSAAVPLVPARRVEIRSAFADSTEAMRWFATERVNLLAALRQATESGHLDIAWKLAITTSGFFELRSYWLDWEDSVRAGLAAAQALGDEFGEAVSNLILADVSWRNGQLEEAADQYRQASRIAHDIPVGWIEGFASRGLGLLREEQGDATGAQGCFQAALRVFRASEHRRGEGMSLLSMGKCARASGDLTQAIAHGEAAVEIFADIDDPWTLAWGALPLAAALADAGRHDDALNHLRPALEVFRGFDDRRSEAMALLSLGDVCRDSGRLTEAHAYWSLAADLYEALGDPRHEEIRGRCGGGGPTSEGRAADS